MRGKADAEATQVYGAAYGEDAEFYAFSRTLAAYKEGQNKKATVILTSDSDFYRYLKRAEASALGRTKR
ncbi:MAG: hypothetical protein ACSLEZ_09135 [Thiobacillus sp.]